jgi:gliding motility-associated-like protein
MRNILKPFFVVLILIVAQAVFAQAPANDACSGAQNIGALPNPGAGACPGGGVRNGTAVTLVGSSTNATSEAPYTTIVDCEAGTTDMASPALDVWYTFTTTGTANSIQISVTNFAGGANLGLWSGTCGSLTPRGCSVDGTLTVEPVAAGQQFFLQVSGSTAAATDPNFNISVQNNFNCNDCFTAGTITATPPPVNGSYQPGQTVNFCFHVDNYNEVSVNWIHGVQLGFGSGWNAGSVVATPAQSWGNDGTWNYYAGGIVSDNNGAAWPRGWYFNRTSAPIGGTGTAGDTNPGNNYGDEGEGGVIPANRWNFCFDITANAACTPGSDLSVNFATSGDGESGFYGSLACTTDPPLSVEASGACCPPVMSSVPLTCNGANNGTATATPTPIGGTYTYNWSGPSGYTNTQTGVVGASTITGLAAGTYSVSVVNASNCVSTGTVNVTQPTAIVATITPTNPSCAGTGSINVTAISGGTGPYDISVDNGSNYAFNNVAAAGNVTGLAAGTYTVFIRDANGCTRAFTATTLTSTGSVNSSFVAPAAQCLTGNSFSFTPTSTGSIVAGTTTYDWNLGGGTNADPAITTSTAAQVTVYPAAGTYTVTLVTATGSCTNTFTTTITVNPMPALPTANLTQPTCGLSNGAINITGPGTTYSLNAAAGPYTATTNYPGLAAGTYTVYVRNGTTCTSNQTFVLTNVPGPTSTALSSTSATCGLANGSVTIGATVGGTSGYTYTLNGSGVAAGLQSNLLAATYTVITTDANSCTVTNTVTVANAAGPSGPNASSTNATCGAANGTVTLAPPTTGTGPFTYSFNGGAFGATTNFTGLVANTYTYVVRDGASCPVNGSIAVNNTAGPTAVALTQVSANCGANNGVINVGAVTGGAGSNQYSINGGGTYQVSTAFTSLAAGTYTVTVKDLNNCTTTNTIVVTSSGAPTVALTTQTNVSCNGGNNGTATFTASGGGGTYTYVLNTGASNLTGIFTNLPLGTYTVTVNDQFSCAATQTVNITQPTALSGSITTQTNVLCNGGNTGSVTVDGLNGTPGYQYSLNGGAFQVSGTFGSLTAGSYTVTVRDNNLCTFPVPVVITEPTAVTVVMSSVNANCTAANGTATATPSGGTGTYTYAWAPSGGTNATTVGVIGGTYTVTVRDANLCQTTGTVTIGITPGGTATISNVTQVNCNGGADGSVTVSMSATAATSYSYAWAPSGGTSATASSLTAGTYTVTVTDNFGCISTANAAVTEPLALTLSLTSTNVSCNAGSDGTITSTTNGGTLSYTYAWSPSVGSTSNISGLPIGTYSLTVTDAHTCTVTANVTLSQPTALSITPVVVNANCNQSDGSFTVTGAGGAGGYSFSLNGGTFINPGNFTGLASGTYTVAIRDGNNCVQSFPVTVGDNAGPSASITASTNVSCFGGNTGNATVTASGGAGGFVYLWSNGSATTTATGLIAGIYTVTATDANGCVASTGVTITEPTLLVANASGVDPLCNGGNNGSGSAGALGGTPPYTYSWTTLPAQTNSNATGLIAGSYNVIVTDNLGCQSTASITLNNPAVLTASITTVNLDCFNQCIGSATAVIGNATLPIQYTWTGGQTTATASGLCAGSYTVNIIDGNNCTATANTIITEPTQLVASIPTSGNETCFNTNDAFAQGTASGGTPGYTFTWSNTFVGANNINLDAGTYTLTVTDNKGCTDVEQVTLTAPPSIGLTVTKTDITCNYAPPYPPINDGTAFATATGGTAPYQYLWQPMLYTVNNPVTLQAGSHTVVVTDGNGCKDSTTIFINEPPEFTITLDADSSNCHFSNGATNVVVTGGATPHAISWSNGVSTPYNPGLPAGQYDITVTDAVGCQVLGTSVVSDIEGPTVTITDSTMITCFGANNGGAVAVANGGVLPYLSLGWSGTTQSGLVATNLGPGPAAILVYDAAGCLGSDQTFIMEPTDVVTGIVSYQDVTCYNLFNGNAIVQATGGLYPTDTNTDNAFTISIASPIQTQAGVALNTSINFSGLGVGAVGSTHIYTVTVTDVRGCQDQTTVTISQPQALVISNPIENDITCFGLSNGQISVTATGGTPVYQYNWTSSNPGFVNPGTPAITGLQAGSYTLSLVDANGCTDNQIAAIIEPTQLLLDSTVVSASCGLANGSATVIGSGGTPIPGGNYLYQWNTSPNQTTQTAIGLATNLYNVQVTDLNGCVANTDVVVPNAAGPSVANITSYQATCFGSSTGAADVDAIGGTAPLVYTWTNSNGTPLVSGPAPNDSIMGIPRGTYNVNVVDANGCFFNAVSVVAEPAQLVLIVSADATMCYGDSVQVSANIGGGTPPYSWTWLHNGTSVPAYNITSGSLSTGPYWVQPSYLTPLHTYSVSLIDGNNCPVSGQTIDITTLPPITISSTNPTACNFDMVTLTANASGGNTSVGGSISYNWTPSNQSTSSITVEAQDNPTHQMTYVVTASDGCSRDTSINVVVTINPKPIANIVGFNTIGCEDLLVNFAAGNPGAGINSPTYEWNFGDNSADGFGSTINHTYTNNALQTVLYDVTMTVTSDVGCSDAVTLPGFVTVYPTPVAAFTFDPLNTTEFDPEINFYNQSLLGNTYDWNFGEIISLQNTSVDVNPMHAYQGPGLYNVFLEVTSVDGCVDTVSHPVYIEPEFAIYVPNAFSPNVDGRNEFFFPQGIGIDEERYNMYIYDRWGELIFETNNLSKGWDGTAKGKAETVQQDTYIWKISAYDLKNNKHNLTGHVTVVR